MTECHLQLINGKCEFNVSTCNNKLIDARSFNLAAKAKGVQSEPPLDDEGHGTHTASTAAGIFVKNADALGNAQGTAVGMGPKAHLAIHKLCFGPDCPDSDILAGLEDAVADGVDVLSISIVDDSQPLFQDNIAVGSFAAIQQGIFVSCSAGNSGPLQSTMSNEAPWILTVEQAPLTESFEPQESWETERNSMGNLCSNPMTSLQSYCLSFMLAQMVNQTLHCVVKDP